MKKYSAVWTACLLLVLAACAYAMENPDLEGWIVSIDTINSTIRVLSANNEGEKLAHDKVVAVKPGWINNYKMNDYVQVKFRTDLPYALMIEKTEPAVGQQVKNPKA